MFEFNETAAMNYSYYSSKYSPINDLNITETAEFKGVELPDIVLNNTEFYNRMLLDRDTHFYNISVNTTHSSVHVPTNVYDKGPSAMETMMWSEGKNTFHIFIAYNIQNVIHYFLALDEVFLRNYQSDPALSWQYFGSDTGIMRHFPGKMWEGAGVDVYDCMYMYLFAERVLL